MLLADFITEKIQKSIETQSEASTIHITGPFVFHELLRGLCNLNNINELVFNSPYYLMAGAAFVYIDDIVPERFTYQEENVYEGYEEDLKVMKVVPHSTINAINFIKSEKEI